MWQVVHGANVHACLLELTLDLLLDLGGFRDLHGPSSGVRLWSVIRSMGVL